MGIGYVQLDLRGGIVVAFPEESTVRQFNRDGRFVQKFGRQGQGPGEFERLSSIGWIADTIWALDRNGERFQLFSRTGRYIRTQSAAATMHDGYAVHPSAMLKDGWFAYNGTLYADAIAAKRPRVTPVTVLKLADGRPKEYGRVTTGSLTLTLPGGGTISGNGRAAQRINQDGLVRFAPNGGFLVSVDRVPRQAGGRAQYTLRRVSPDGHVERERTFYAPAVTISDSHMRDFVNSYTDAMRKGPRRRYFPSAGSARDYLLTNLPLPTAYPLVSGLLVGTDSSVWLRGIDEGRSQVS